MFALGVFDGTYSFPLVLVALFIYLIPSLIIIVILALVWRWELVGVVIFSLLGLFYVVMLFRDRFEFYILSWIFTIALPPILVGLLFYISWKIKKK